MLTTNIKISSRQKKTHGSIKSLHVSDAQVNETLKTKVSNSSSRSTSILYPE
jgi:hypothetical protein